MKKTLLLLALLVALINSQCTVIGCQTCPTSADNCTSCNAVLGFGTASADGSQCPCAGGFYFISATSVCFPCLFTYSNCADCDQVACTSCKPGYLNVSGQCRHTCETLFLGCSTCSGNDCTSCDSARNLTISADNKSCLCTTGFAKIQPGDDFCVACHYFKFGCATCSDRDNCDSCLTPSKMNASCDCVSGYYIQEKSNYFLAQTCQTCSGMTGCSSCTSATVCNSCTSNTFFLSAGQCRSCSSANSNCNTCSGTNGDCDSCNKPFVVDSGGCSSCDKNNKGCTNCTTVDSCIDCDTTKNYKPKAVLGQCECTVNSYDDGTGCVLCSSSILNCDECDSAPSCSKCIKGFIVNSGSCSACILGCVDCDNPTTCKQCNKAAGFDLQTGTNKCICKSDYFLKDTICVACIDTLIGCTQCQNETRCTQCDDKKYYQHDNFTKKCYCNSTRYHNFSSSACQLCSAVLTNCEECSNSTYCDQCATGYTQVYTFGPTQSTCALCSTLIVGCLDCATPKVCTNCDFANNFAFNGSSCQCAPAYYLNSGACTLCSASFPQCTTCTSSGCTACAVDYFLNSTSKLCQLCSSIPQCTACDSSGCTACVVDYFLNVTNRICKLCTTLNPQCTACDSSGCTACTVDYFLNPTSTLCQPCNSLTAQCTSCDSSGCIACAANYFLNATNKVCQQCTSFSPQCTNCTPTGCSACEDDYVVSSTSCARLCSIQLCLDCFNSTTCQFCVIHATLSGDHTICNCNTGYFSDSTECVQCSNSLTNCVECESALECTACAADYFLNASSKLCQLCTSTTPQCTACDSSGCIACAASYFLNATSKLCQLCTSFSPQCTACTSSGCSACVDDYVVSNTSCARLCSIQLCIGCFDSTTCMFCVIHSTLNDDRTECNCNTGYFSNSTNCALCSSVLTNCVECDNALECTACEDGFVVDLETDQCVAFESSLKMASLLLVLVFAALSF